MKVPLLGDIPLIGGLFRSETETKVRTELLIVLTPHVVTSNQSTDLIDRTRELIEDLPLPQKVIDQIRRGSLEGDGGAFGSSFEPVSGDSGPEGVQ